MTNALDVKDDDRAWDELRSEIGEYMELVFILNGPRDKEVWQYLVGVAAHLEYLAVAVLWIEAGKPCAFPEYEQQLTLGQAARRLDQRGLPDATTIETLSAVARLRNSVAHKGAMYGVTITGHEPDPDRGVYKGGHVFSDPVALRRLVDEANAAIDAMGGWLRVHRRAT
jgi:hypothetical protein